MTRNRHSSPLLVVAALTLAAAAFGTGTALANHDTDTIHACVTNSNGSLRLVDGASDCRSNERAVEWSKESPIPTPQACPAGQFVTGIDGGGNLTCATPGTMGGGGGGFVTACPDPLPTLPNARTGCDPSSGNIFIRSCDVGYHNLNGVDSDGCEYGFVLYSGPEVCDGQDNDANGSVDELVVGPQVPNGTASCANGTFILACEPGYADENGVLSDGCEVRV